jgi:hypothetical protein
MKRGQDSWPQVFICPGRSVRPRSSVGDDRGELVPHPALRVCPGEGCRNRNQQAGVTSASWFVERAPDLWAGARCLLGRSSAPPASRAERQGTGAAPSSSDRELMLPGRQPGPWGAGAVGVRSKKKALDRSSPPVESDVVNPSRRSEVRRA